MQRADQRKFHYIYKITRDDGRYYVGMHSTDDLNDGYFGSGKKITRSIKKHGKERHSKKILEFLPTRKELKAREEEMITEEMRDDPLCMNMAPGGGGGFIDAEHQLKCASAGGKKSWSKSLHLMHTSEAAKKRVETRRKDGTLATCGMLGKSHSILAKQKMSLSGSGSNNSQFGTCWVVKNSAAIKIKKELLSEYLQQGYSRGRK
jgi:hypothetical protein